MRHHFAPRKPAGGFRFRLKASNGEVVAPGESYTTKPADIGASSR
ncbi:YegP family protein [Arthrobacter sp. 18067]